MTEERDKERRKARVRGTQRWRNKINVGQADKQAQEIADQQWPSRSEEWWAAYWYAMERMHFPPYDPKSSGNALPYGPPPEPSR